MLCLVTAEVVLHLATASRYGIFRDELYYLACARHLAWGYVDHPPLIAFVTWITVHTLGTSLLGLRTLPALAGGAAVWLTARVARELGGGRFAQGLASFAMIPVPIFLILDHWLTMNAFEPLIWLGIVWSVLRAINTGRPRYWLGVGALTGIGLENKYSILFFVLGLGLGLVLTEQRRWLGRRAFWIGAAFALLLFLPNLIWLIGHDFPFLEFERHSRMSGGRIERGPIEFVADQALIMNPVLLPLWVAGIVQLARTRDTRALAWAFIASFLLLLTLKAKNYYLAAAYPPLFAAGAVVFERMTLARLRWLRYAYPGTILASGVILAPLVMPILPIDAFQHYQAWLGGFTPVRFENRPAQELPQYFADEFGWEEMARETAVSYHLLPADQQPGTAIFANNYGEAAAIDFFGPRYGLPPAISTAESYWLWGPRNYTGKSVIVLGSDGSGDRAHFRTVDIVGRVDVPLARSEEHFDIFLCRDLTSDLRVLWPRIKSW